MDAADRPRVPADCPRVRDHVLRRRAALAGSHATATTWPSGSPRRRLYRRDLDLAVVAGDEVAGYALFWPDPVTGVGLVEPMRVEDEHAGKGLGGASWPRGWSAWPRRDAPG